MAHIRLEQHYPKLNKKAQTARQNGDEAQICLMLANQGFDLFQQRQYEEGLQHFEQAIELSATLSDITLQVRCLNLKMLALQHVPRLPDAYNVAEEILQLGKTHNQPGIQCDALTSQGQIVLESGEPIIATEKLQAAQQIADQLGDKRRQMNVLGMMGHTGLAVAATEQAGIYFKQAQSLAKELGDTSAEIGFEGNHAIVLTWQGNHTEAATAFERVRAYAAETYNSAAEIQALRHLVKAYAQLQNYAELIAYAQHGLTLADQSDTETRFFFLSAEIPALHQQGRVDEAKEALAQATQIVQKIRGGQKKLDPLLTLCEFYELLEMPDTADICLTALDQTVLLNRQKDQVNLISRLGRLMTDKRQLIEAFEARLPQLAKDNIPVERSMLHILIKACLDASEFDKAIAYTQRALTLAREADDQSLVERYRLVLIDALFEAGRYPEIVTTIKAMLTDQSAAIDKATELHLRQLQSNAYFEMGELEPAVSVLETALPLSDQVEQPQSKARILGQLGSIYAEQGDLERANTYIAGAIEQAHALNDFKTMGELLCVLALNYRDLGQTAQALDYCKQAIEIFQKNNEYTLTAKVLNLKRELQSA